MYISTSFTFDSSAVSNFSSVVHYYKATGFSYNGIDTNGTVSPENSDDGRSYIYNPAFRRNPSCDLTSVTNLDYTSLGEKDIF